MTLVPATEEVVEKLEAFRPHPQMEAEGFTSWFAVEAAKVTYSTRHLVEIKLKAVDMAQAIESARREVVNVLGALNLGANRPFLIQLVTLQALEGPDRRRVGTWSPYASVWPFEATKWEKGDEEAFGKRYKKIRDHSKAAAAARYLQQGVSLHLVLDGQTPSSDDLTNSASILNLLQCIELIASEVAKDLKAEKDTMLEEQEQIVVSLVQSLEKAGTVEARIKHVREANNALGRLELRFLDLQIEATAGTLGMDPDSVTEAQRLAGFRNAHLGHPRTDPPPPEQLQYWLGEDMKAYRLALTFLSAYVQHL